MDNTRRSLTVRNAARHSVSPATGLHPQGSEDEIEFDERVFGDSVNVAVEQANGARCAR